MRQLCQSALFRIGVIVALVTTGGNLVVLTDRLRVSIIYNLALAFGGGALLALAFERLFCYLFIRSHLPIAGNAHKSALLPFRRSLEKS